MAYLQRRCLLTGYKCVQKIYLKCEETWNKRQTVLAKWTFGLTLMTSELIKSLEECPYYYFTGTTNDCNHQSNQGPQQTPPIIILIALL